MADLLDRLTLIQSPNTPSSSSGQGPPTRVFGISAPAASALGFHVATAPAATFTQASSPLKQGLTRPPTTPTKYNAEPFAPSPTKGRPTPRELREAGSTSSSRRTEGPPDRILTFRVGHYTQRLLDTEGWLQSVNVLQVLSHRVNGNLQTLVEGLRFEFEDHAELIAALMALDGLGLGSDYEF